MHFIADPIPHVRSGLKTAQAMQLPSSNHASVDTANMQLHLASNSKPSDKG